MLIAKLTCDEKLREMNRFKQFLTKQFKNMLIIIPAIVLLTLAVTIMVIVGVFACIWKGCLYFVRFINAKTGVWWWIQSLRQPRIKSGYNYDTYRELLSQTENKYAKHYGIKTTNLARSQLAKMIWKEYRHYVFVENIKPIINLLRGAIIND